MTTSSLHAAAFYKEITENKKLYTVKDKNGHPSPLNLSGKRAMPFWSSRSRTEKIIEKVKDYNNFEVNEISLNEFRERWLPGLEKDSLLVGINWSGDIATGYDIEPNEVLSNIENYK